MSGQTTESRDDLQVQVDELQKRVELLESILVGAAGDRGRDQYDTYVLQRLQETDDTVFTKHLHIWYRQSGVRSKNKRRDRIKALAEDGLIEPVGAGGWRPVDEAIPEPP